MLHFVSFETFYFIDITNLIQWFHTLIVLLHQPTLLHSFGGRIQQLFPNSRELSISSAKTIADILAFAELIDAKSFVGNPFTSQPMYIAACAFLMESAFYSCPSSTTGSPPTVPLSKNLSSGFTIQASEVSNGNRKSSSKHNLLASAAKDNYQRCYKALKSLETYWEGTKYILTVLDQKAKGIGDPLLYTTEEMDSAVELGPPTPFTSTVWKKPTTQPHSADPATNQQNDHVGNGPPSEPTGEAGSSPKIDPSQGMHLILPSKWYEMVCLLTNKSYWVGPHRCHEFLSAQSKLPLSARSRSRQHYADSTRIQFRI